MDDGREGGMDEWVDECMDMDGWSEGVDGRTDGWIYYAGIGIILKKKLIKIKLI